MQVFRLAVVQHKSGRNVRENVAAAERYIREAAENGARLVLFPECFLTGYYAPDVPPGLPPLAALEEDAGFCAWRDAALDEGGPEIAAVRTAATKAGVNVVITAFTKGIRRPRNTAVVIGADGVTRMTYHKVHTCDFDWERYVEGGDRFNVCRMEGLKLGVMICYDREHPESARELMLQGAELIVVPNDCGGMAPRLAELSVAAMQNMSVVAMANPPGDNAGRSCVYEPMVWDDAGRPRDNLLAAADETFDGILYADFDTDALRAYRESEFLGRNRKPQAYRHLVRNNGE